jgi:1-deoxy-D-xylulose-5-phosphate reductoisomerase
MFQGDDRMGLVMKRVAILGSTGSIGVNTLEVTRRLGDRIGVVGLSANRRIDELRSQAEEFQPSAVGICDETLRAQAEAAFGRIETDLFWGSESLIRLVQMPEVDLVVNAVVGAAGIRPTMAAIEAGKDVAIANKESLVAAGAIIMGAARRSGVDIIPVDSEHSAVFQCLRGEISRSVRRIILTASGGPLIDMGPEEIAGVRAVDALRHPTWSMGRKVTIDSATLLNKGFEVIEAQWLFGIAPERIDVVIERRSIVHSLVEYIDGSVMALMSVPDMRLPIQYALTHPDRIETGWGRLDLASAGPIGFEHPDLERFPCLALAYEVARMGGTAGAVLSAADEVAVDAFIQGKISFADIHSTLRNVVSMHKVQAGEDLDAVIEADRWARREAGRFIERLSRGK